MYVSVTSEWHCEQIPFTSADGSQFTPTWANSNRSSLPLLPWQVTQPSWPCAVSRNSSDTWYFSSAENSGAAGPHPPVSAPATGMDPSFSIGCVFVWQAMHFSLGCGSISIGLVNRAVHVTGEGAMAWDASFLEHPVVANATRQAAPMKATEAVLLANSENLMQISPFGGISILVASISSLYKPLNTFLASPIRATKPSSSILFKSGMMYFLDRGTCSFACAMLNSLPTGFPYRMLPASLPYVSIG